MEAKPNPPEWEYVGATWPAAASGVTGWDHHSVGAVMITALPEFIRVAGSTEPLGILPLAPYAPSESGHNISMTFGYVLARAALGTPLLSMLDWGGALGHYAIMARHLLPDATLQITVKERPEMCRIGRQLLPWVTFETSDAACFARGYDLVMASTSLQYAEDWRGIFNGLAGSTKRWLFVTRLSVVRGTPSFVVVQRPYAYGFQTEYLSWVINRDELLHHASGAGMTLEREFIAGSPTTYVGAPAASETAGYLFRKSA